MIRWGIVPIEYSRTPAGSSARLAADPTRRGPAVPGTVFGNFLEHLGFAIHGGLWAQELANPTFTRDPHLLPKHVDELLQAGAHLTAFFSSGNAPQTLPPNWVPWGDPTGFGVMALDDARHLGIPFPWAPLGEAGKVKASVGRLGGAVRLFGGTDQAAQTGRVPLEGGPAGIRQGLFLPVKRECDYHGDIWVRIAAQDEDASGVIEIGVRRRVGSQEGERIAWTNVPAVGGRWIKHAFQLHLPEEAVQVGEPVDIYLRWLPDAGEDHHLLVDRFFLYPDDRLDEFDPTVVRLTREWLVPLLRWPGGNFASVYHWRDGVGPLDRRPTRKNDAWYGLEYNAIGTDEFIRFCRLIDAQPQITVNIGTGTPEEAAAWVEYCNGDISTPMGKLRAANGNPEPYNVRLWEIGNEIYGAWQGGYFGAEENALRGAEFAEAMRAADPTIELIATGSGFDFVQPQPAFDHTTADRVWHAHLLEKVTGKVAYISLHCLPSNDRFLEDASLTVVHQALMGQLSTWERHFLPDLLRLADEYAAQHEDIKPMQLAITEWAILGRRGSLPWADTYGEVLYAGLFLIMMARNAGRIPVANATGLLHGGSIRKVAGQYFCDPQYAAMQLYSRLIGAEPLACRLEAPGFDVPVAADLGAPEQDIPYIDALVCWKPGQADEGGGLYLALVNLHLEELIQARVTVPALPANARGKLTTISHPDITARATWFDPQPYSTVESSIHIDQGVVQLDLPPGSINLAWFPPARD
jgi:alpha-L-arabinofuranosidase